MALDLKGFGDSEKPYLSRYYSDGVIIEEIKKFVDIIHERKKKIVVLGHGLGGQIGWKLVEKYPEMVSKFVSISTPHPKVWLSHLTRSWSSMIQNRWLYECRLPFLPELQMVDNDLEVFDKRFKKWNSTVDLANYSNFDKVPHKEKKMFLNSFFAGGIQVHLFQDCGLAGVYKLLQESPPLQV